MLGLEFRFAVRSLSRAKTYTVLSILTLGAAIGASAAIYTILYGVAASASVRRPRSHRHGLAPQ